MGWIIEFFTSSIGRKVIMSLTGLFLIVFLIVHLIGNVQLLYQDGGEAFNIYADFMGNNPFIQFTSKGLYFFIVLHAIVGILLALKNRSAKGKKYAVNTRANSSFASRNMALLGTLVLAFIFIHMGDFWYKMKFDDQIAMATYDGQAVKDLYLQVKTTFSKPIWVISYVIGMMALAFHLWHGFESAFQTLGINHKKYTPIISILAKAYAILIPLAFAMIPILMYFQQN